MTTREHVACFCGSRAPEEPALHAIWARVHAPDSAHGESGKHFPATRNHARKVRLRLRIEREQREGATT